MTVDQVALLLAGLVGGSLVKVFFDVIKERYTSHLRQVDKLRTLTAVQQQQINEMSTSRDTCVHETATTVAGNATVMHRSLENISRSLAELLRDVGALRSEVAEFRGRQITHMNATDARLDILERRLERVESQGRRNE